MFHMKQGSGMLNRSGSTKRLFPGAALIVFSFPGVVAVPDAARAQERESAAKLVARTTATTIRWPRARTATYTRGLTPTGSTRVNPWLKNITELSRVLRREIDLVRVFVECERHRLRSR